MSIISSLDIIEDQFSFCLKVKRIRGRKKSKLLAEKEERPPPAGTRTRCENPFLVVSPPSLQL